MPLYEWDTSYSVDNAEIDEQHKRFFELLNQLDAILMSGDVDKVKRSARDAVEALGEYAALHFADEERYLEELGYPDLAAHQFEHARLVRQISGYRDDLFAGRVILSTTLLKTMAGWLTGHILVTDKKYAAFASDAARD